MMNTTNTLSTAPMRPRLASLGVGVLLLLFLFTPQAHGQIFGGGLKVFTSDVTGNACSYRDFAVDNSTGTWYYCNAGVYASIASAGGSLPSQTGNAGKLLGTDGTNAGWRVLQGFTDDGTNLTPDGTLFAEVDGNNTWTGHQYYPTSTQQSITAVGNTITCDRRSVSISADAVYTLTSAPTIADGTDGQVCVIVNTGTNAITLQDQDTLALSNLQLVAGTITIPAKGQLTLQFNAALGDWIQDGVRRLTSTATCREINSTLIPNSVTYQDFPSGAGTFTLGTALANGDLVKHKYWITQPANTNASVMQVIQNTTKLYEVSVTNTATTTGILIEIEEAVVSTGQISKTNYQKNTSAPTTSTATSAATNTAPTWAVQIKNATGADVDDSFTLVYACIEITHAK